MKFRALKRTLSLINPFWSHSQNLNTLKQTSDENKEKYHSYGIIVWSNAKFAEQTS